VVLEKVWGVEIPTVSILHNWTTTM